MQNQNNQSKSILLSTKTQWKIIKFIFDFAGFFITMAGITLIANDFGGTNHGVEYVFQMSVVGFSVLVLLRAAFPKKGSKEIMDAAAELGKVQEEITNEIKRLNEKLEEEKLAFEKVQSTQEKLAPDGFKREVIKCSIDGRTKYLVLEYPDNAEFTSDRKKIESMIDEVLDHTVIGQHGPIREDLVLS